VKRRVLARGLILRASASSAETTYRGQRFELRDLTLDVEVPGQAPYEISVTARVPRIVEALPGATLDLSLDPASPNDLEILGPAGASDWITAAAAVPGQTWCPRPPTIPWASPRATPGATPATAGPGAGPAPLATPGAGRAVKGCGIVVAVLVAVVVALAAIVATVSRRHTSRTTPTHTSPRSPGHHSRPGHPH
jgi:hypothetical protein